MVGDGGHVSVLDFGLARLADREGDTPVETLTSPGMVLGSCPYMAPEQALGQGVTQASDIFSCGAVLYECLSGTRAFDGPTPMKVLQAVVRTEYPPLQDVAPYVPSELVAVVERCLEKDPGKRYRTCADLAHDLAVFQGTDAVSLAEAPTLAISSGKLEAVVTRRRRLAIRGSAIAAFALAAGLLAGALGGRFGTEPRRPDPGRWEARALMDTVGTMVDPSWRPDGSEIVVARNQVGASEILAVDPSTGNAGPFSRRNRPKPSARPGCRQTARPCWWRSWSRASPQSGCFQPLAGRRRPRSSTPRERPGLTPARFCFPVRKWMALGCTATRWGGGKPRSCAGPRARCRG